MPSYQIQLRETRLSTDGTDDVALFDLTRNEDGATWIVPSYLSPLFRIMRMPATVSPDRRREMVVGLGARAIAEQLSEGSEPQLIGPLVFTVDYPGAPGDPDLLSPDEQGTVEVKVGSSTY